MSRREEYFEGATLSPDEVTFQREGLPDDYRMRYEEDHYVDELVAAGSMPQLRLVPVSEIEGGFGSGGESLDGLIDSIQAYGVLQPLLVRRLRGRYELLAGSKRLAAAVNAGLKEVPCLVHEVDDVEARRLAEAANRRASRTAVASSSSLQWSTDAMILVAGSLNTILSTLGLLDKPDSSLRDRVAVALVHNSDRGRELAWPRLPSSDHLAIRHPERRHRVENLAPDPCLDSLCRQPSRSHR